MRLVRSLSPSWKPSVIEKKEATTKPTRTTIPMKNVDLPPKIASQVERTLKNCIDMSSTWRKVLQEVA